MAPTSALPESASGFEHHLPTYRALLEEQWRTQMARLTHLPADALNSQDAEAEADGRTEDLHVAARLIAAVRQQLQETEAALRRIDDRSYGFCGHCRRPIPVERLEILPAARYCVACQQRHGSRR